MMTVINPLISAYKKLSLLKIAKLLISQQAFLLIVFSTTIIGTISRFLVVGNFYNGDEEIYLRVINLFQHNISIELLRNYQGEPASPAPLFFIIYSFWGRLFGFTYPVFCGLSLILNLLTMLFINVFLYKESMREERIFFPFLIFFFPYIFYTSFSIMAEPLNLLFTVIGLCCYMKGLNSNSKLALLLGSIAITAALYVRIHSIFAVGALIVVLLLQKNRSIIRWLLALIPIIARLPLIFIQGGLTVSREAIQGSTMPELGFYLSNINFSFVWLGSFFFPLLWCCNRKYWLNKITITFILIPFYILKSPNFIGMEYAGILRSLLIKLELNITLAQWLLFPFWLIGLYITIELIHRILLNYSLRETFLCSCIVLFMVSLVFSSVIFERYYQIIVPSIAFLGVSKPFHRNGYIAILVLHILFCVFSVFRNFI